MHQLHSLLHITEQHQLQPINRSVSDYEGFGSLTEKERQPMEAIVDLAVGRNQLVLSDLYNVVTVNLY